MPVQIPTKCFACGSKNVRRHCDSESLPGANCRWVICLFCRATNGYDEKERGVYFGGRDNGQDRRLGFS